MSRHFLHQDPQPRKPAALYNRHLSPVILLSLAAFSVVLWGAGSLQSTSARPTIEEACTTVSSLAGSGRDAGPALQACLDTTPDGKTVALAPGRYLIATPIRLRHPLTLQTHGLDVAGTPCFSDERRCASFHLAIAPSAAAAGAVMPFDIDSADVRLDGLVFEGTRLSDPDLSAKRCASDKEKPMAGGLRVNGNGIWITRSVFRDMACYTALEYGAGEGAVIENNAFSSNGTHNVQLRWADGLTIHSGKHFRVTDNQFHDNTDVQLIFGSCIDCTVANNHFSHGGSAEGGSFAEIMLQAWPKATSGDFTGTKVTHNAIDCGPQRRCGFGIMIGSAPWYDAPTFGGAVTDNKVRGAMLALNVDKLTGPMAIERNDLNSSSGTYPTMCGPRSVNGITTNISPESVAFLAGPLPKGVSSSHYCILNYELAK